MVALFYSLIFTHDSGIIHTEYALFEGGIILYQDAGLGHMVKKEINKMILPMQYGVDFLCKSNP